MLIFANGSRTDAPAFGVTAVILGRGRGAALPISFAIAVVTAVRFRHQSLPLGYVTVDLVRLEPIIVHRIWATAGLGSDIQFGGAFKSAGTGVRLFGAALLIIGATIGAFGSPTPLSAARVAVATTRLPKG